MILLADEDVSRPIVERLRADGHTVMYVVEMDRGIDDEIVLGQANEHNAILLTEDKDFGELVFRQGLFHGGVILVRLEGLRNSSKAHLVSQAIASRSAEMLGAFTVISPGLVRIRRTP